MGVSMLPFVTRANQRMTSAHIAPERETGYSFSLYNGTPKWPATAIFSDYNPFLDLHY